MGDRGESGYRHCKAMIVTRLVATLALLFLASAAPLVFTVCFALILICYFRNYFEAIFIFLLMDFVYGMRGERIIFPLTLTCIALALVYIAEKVRNKLFV